MQRIGLLPLLIMTTVMVTLFPQSETKVPSSVKDQIVFGFDAGKQIAEILKEHVKEVKETLQDVDFKNNLRKMGAAFGPYLGALGPFAGVLLGFIPVPESKEITLMKDMMKDIDNNFNQVESRLSDIENLIKWKSFEERFGEIENNILTMADEYKDFYESATVGHLSLKDEYMKHWWNTYDNSGVRMCQAILGNTVIREDFGKTIADLTKNDRRAAQTFLYGMLTLLSEAMRIDLTYYALKNDTLLLESKKRSWSENIIQVRKKFESIDEDIKNMWWNQSSNDTDEFAVGKSKWSNKGFSSGLYNLLAKKYFWRDWLVVVYNPISGRKNHRVSGSGGHVRYRLNGERNILIASEDKDSSSMGKRVARQRLENVRDKIGRPYIEALFGLGDPINPHHSAHSLSYTAEYIYDNIDRTDASSCGVIRLDADVQYKCGEEKAFSSLVTTAGGDYRLYIWG